MKRLIVVQTIILFILLPLLTTVGCQEQPEPAPPTPAPAPPTPSPTEALPSTPVPTPGPAPPTPTPAPAPAPQPPPPAPDEPSLSVDEACSRAWSKLPSELPDGYSKSQFDVDTRKATYEGNGEWTFAVSGSGKFDWSTPSWQQNKEVLEKTPGNWVEQKTIKVTTYELSLTAVFDEETEALEIIDIEKSNEQLDTEVTETPIQEVIRVHWVKGEYILHRYHFEGTVENIGKVPLNEIQIELVCFGEDGNLLATELAPLDAETINPGERAHFMHKVTLKMDLKSYNYRFVTASGKEFFRVSEDVHVLPP